MPDRELLEAKYTSPSGKEFTFLWEKASKKIQLKTGVFTYPDKDGAHVQHQGGGPVTFPFQCIFNGEGHIKNADNFEVALLERDVAELQHPLYGIRKVIPTGDIQRDNDYVNTLNETHVTVTFTETLTDEEPAKLEAVTADEIENDFDEFLESAAADFAESLTIKTIDEKLEIQAILNSEADILNDNLSGLVSSADSIRSDFDVPAIDSVSGKNKFANFITSMRELKNNIKSFLNKSESLVQKALNIARLNLNLMKIPSRMIINTTEKIKGYSRLISQITNQFKNEPYGTNKIKNAFASTRLVLSGAIVSVSSGAALSIANSAARREALTPAGSGGGVAGSTPGPGGGASGGGSASGGSTAGGGAAASGVLTREAAVAVAVQLKSLLRDIHDFEDVKIEKNNFIDSNASTYLLMVQLINKSIQLILTSCFALPMKRTIKLDRDRNFIELCAELYGTVDDIYLDRLIIENNLNVDELEIIPMGREVAYYVEST
jgi:prophage DNA circulation protein